MSEQFLSDEGQMERGERTRVADPFGDVPEDVYTTEIEAALAANPDILERIAEAEQGDSDADSTDSFLV